jgi:exopolysaccharide biosynthesis polyprenyl glycosylphosphotransferase
LDIILMLVAFGLAYYVRYEFQWFRNIDPAYYTTFRPYIPLAILLTTLVFIAFVMEGVYRPRRGATAVDEIYAVINGTTTGFVIMVFIVFFWRPLVYSRLVFVYATAFSILLLAMARLARRAVLAMLRSRGIGVDRVLVVGFGEVGLQVMRNLIARPELGYQIVGFVDDDPERSTANIGRVKALGTTRDLPQVLSAAQIDDAIITIPWQDQRRRIVHILDQCSQAGVRPLIVPDLFQMSLSVLDIQDVAGIPMLSPSKTRLAGWARAFKRTVDVLGASLGLIILSPILLLIAVAIRVDSPGPALFLQLRVGRDGKLFYVHKFRSMVQDADRMKDAILHLNEAEGPLFKIRNDPRMTRVGRFLRRTSLDELPQLWDVLRGDMSLVGPRPALPEEVAGYAEWHKRRLHTAPGITGLWQVSGRSDLPFEEMILLDIYYIENWSPALDLSIMLRTLPRVLMGSGAY